MLQLSRFPSIRTSDPDVFYASIKSRNPGSRAIAFPGRGSRVGLIANAATLGDTTIVSGRSTSYALGLDPDQRIRAHIPSRGAVELKVGATTRTVMAHEGACLFPVAPVDATLRGPFSSLVVSIDRRRIQRAVSALESDDDVGEVLNEIFAQPSRPGLGAFVAQVQATCRALDEGSPMLIAADAFRRAHDELIVLSLANALAQARAAVEPAGADHPLALRRCLDYLAVHSAGEVSLEAMQIEAGVSLRVAQGLFRRHLGRTITEHLRSLRLAAVRRRLLQPGDGDSVTSVALDCGFAHLGEFGSAYRRAYGERPSETLRNARFLRGRVRESEDRSSIR